jgi:hypothetical protein
MTDKEMQRKLEQLAKLANELDAAAKDRFGQQGFLFYEATGSFHIMDGDSGHFAERTKHARLSSRTLCHMGAGAW